MKVTVADEDVTGVAGAALWGPLLDRLNVVGEADRRALRPIGPGGYTGGECYRTLVEVLLAGGDFLVGPVAARRRHRAAAWRACVPSHTTLFRFCAGADFGRAAKAAAVNRTMLARAWALGAGPDGGWSRSTRTRPWSPPTGRARKDLGSLTAARPACRR